MPLKSDLHVSDSFEGFSTSKKDSIHLRFTGREPAGSIPKICSALQKDKESKKTDRSRTRSNWNHTQHSTLQCRNRGIFRRKAKLFLERASALRSSSWEMALTNFIVTVVGVGAAILLFRTDARQSAAIFRRNLRQIRNWLEEETASTAKSMERSSAKELDSQIPKKETPKDEKH
ncbi:hypothetical protein ZIOFF_057125 [Zingiber officinale]|uniref:Transmembrane protein n=2 Tax=Zingiber officinale TaxID=94328 RepID=A0A8J5KBK0_ZINOF|nr:hypothetical protein ZIOFF_057125 [Zingiber officinale]